MKKMYIIRSQKCKNRPSKPKNGIWVPKTVLEIIHGARKNIILSIKKEKRSLKSPKTEGPKINMFV
jgi:hypothetical protein